jgi:hypothetical protein
MKHKQSIFVKQSKSTESHFTKNQNISSDIVEVFAASAHFEAGKNFREIILKWLEHKYFKKFVHDKR